MIDFLLSDTLIVTAIISLIGALIAAILNFTCNVKVNKLKIEHEERKIRSSFLTNSFKELREAAKELYEMKIYADEKARESIIKYNARAKDIFNSIKPLISKENKDKLERRYSDVEKKMSAIQIKSITDKEFSNDDIEIAKNIAIIDIEEAKLRHELSRIIDIEISIIADELKKNKV